MTQLTKMQQGGVIVSVEPSRVDFMLAAGWRIVDGGPENTPAPEAVEPGASAEEASEEVKKKGRVKNARQ